MSTLLMMMHVLVMEMEIIVDGSTMMILHYQYLSIDVDSNSWQEIHLHHYHRDDDDEVMMMVLPPITVD